LETHIIHLLTTPLVVGVVLICTAEAVMAQLVHVSRARVVVVLAVPQAVGVGKAAVQNLLLKVADLH